MGKTDLTLSSKPAENCEDSGGGEWQTGGQCQPSRTRTEND